MFFLSFDFFPSFCWISFRALARNLVTNSTALVSWLLSRHLKKRQDANLDGWNETCRLEKLFYKTNWIGLILRKTNGSGFLWLGVLFLDDVDVAADDVDGLRPLLYHLLQRGLHLAARLGAGHLRTGRLRHAFHPLPETLLARIRSPFLQSKKLCLGRVTRCRHIAFCFLCTTRYVPEFSSEASR